MSVLDASADCANKKTDGTEFPFPSIVMFNYLHPIITSVMGESGKEAGDHGWMWVGVVIAARHNMFRSFRFSLVLDVEVSSFLHDPLPLQEPHFKHRPWS